MAWVKWSILPYVLLLSITPTHSKNIGPSVQVSSSFDFTQERRNVPQVPVDHVFFANYQKNFSWHDDALQERLWHGRRPKRHKRKSARKTSPNHGHWKYGVPAVDLKSLTSAFLQKQILIPTAQLQSVCVFYTAVQGPDDALKRRKLSGFTVHENLSKLATDWACSDGKVTIWNLYSGANDVTGAVDNIKYYNYWEVYVAGSWLNPLLEPPNPPGFQFSYFANMSNAMAQVCGGVIYVASLDPKNLQKYQFIWANDEYPTLKKRWLAGGYGAPTLLISVDISDPRNQYIMNFNDLSYNSDLTTAPPKRDKMWEEDEELQKRDNCNANVAYEPSTEDWFGVGGRIGLLGYN